MQCGVEHRDGNAFPSAVVRSCTHCSTSCLTPSTSPRARYSMSGQNSSPQNGSSRTAVSTASSQKSKPASRQGDADSSSAPASRHATAINRMVGSECNTCSTMHAAHCSVTYQSRSSLRMLCSQAKALRASPRNTRSLSTRRPGRQGSTLDATCEACRWRRNRGRRRVWMMSRCSRNVVCSSWE